MGAKELGAYLDAARRKRGWTLARTAYEIGMLDEGRVLNETQAKRILDGRRILSRELAGHVIDRFDLSPAEADEAWRLSGYWPPDLDVEDVRRFREFAALQPTGTTRRYRAVNPRRLRPAWAA